LIELKNPLWISAAGFLFEAKLCRFLYAAMPSFVNENQQILANGQQQKANSQQQKLASFGHR
jgi:hypothetical protein